jgi:hypothetical protein
VKALGVVVALAFVAFVVLVGFSVVREETPPAGADELRYVCADGAVATDPSLCRRATPTGSADDRGSTTGGSGSGGTAGGSGSSGVAGSPGGESTRTMDTYQWISGDIYGQPDTCWFAISGPNRPLAIDPAGRVAGGTFRAATQEEYLRQKNEAQEAAADDPNNRSGVCPEI